MLKIDLQAEKINAYKKQETICAIIVLVFAIIGYFIFLWRFGVVSFEVACCVFLIEILVSFLILCVIDCFFLEKRDKTFWSDVYKSLNKKFDNFLKLNCGEAVKTFYFKEFHQKKSDNCKKIVADTSKEKFYLLDYNTGILYVVAYKEIIELNYFNGERQIEISEKDNKIKLCGNKTKIFRLFLQLKVSDEKNRNLYYDFYPIYPMFLKTEEQFDSYFNVINSMCEAADFLRLKS